MENALRDSYKAELESMQRILSRVQRVTVPRFSSLISQTRMNTTDATYRRRNEERLPVRVPITGHIKIDLTDVNRAILQTHERHLSARESLSRTTIPAQGCHILVGT